MAKYADAVSPMIDPAEAFAKIDAYCREIGRDPREIRRTGGGHLFLNDDSAMQRRAIEWAVGEYGGREEDIRRNGLFGSADEVRAGVQRLIDRGVQEIYVFQLPRVHVKSVFRFSEEVIPAFR